MAKPTGIPKAAPPADPTPEKTGAATTENPETGNQEQTNQNDQTDQSNQNPETSTTPPTDPTPPADPTPEKTGETVTTDYLRATKDTLYDAYSKNYFYTNRATRVDLPLNSWLICQIDAGLLEKCAKDYGPLPMHDDGESDNDE